MTKLSKEAEMVLIAERIVDAIGENNIVWDELRAAGFWGGMLGEITPTGRDYLRDKRIVIVDIVELSNIIITEFADLVIEGQKPGGIGYVQIGEKPPSPTE